MRANDYHEKDMHLILHRCRRDNLAGGADRYGGYKGASPTGSTLPPAAAPPKLNGSVDPTEVD